ncbi:MAG: ATP synthase subunit I, partial [Nitrospirae bacterium]|nr:ATP synthase subunit I [Nitrospirota bacterium]
MNLVKRIYKQSIFILTPLAVISVFIDWPKLPMGIFVGGILGLVNFRALARGVYGLTATYKPTGKLIFFSLFRLAILAIVLGIIIISKKVNPFGILIGFTAVFISILREGLRSAKEPPEE